MKPLVSIIIPMFNNEISVTETIKSILKQTYENIELILVDDGSFDNTPKIVEKYVKRDSRVSLFFGEAEGKHKVHQIAMQHAKGDYIVFFEPGCLMSYNLIEYFVELLEQKDSDIFVFDHFPLSEYIMYSPHDIQQESPEENLLTMDNIKYQDYISSTDDHIAKNSLILWNKIIKKSWLEKTSYLKDKQELCISYPMLQTPAEIAVSNQILICEVLYDAYFIRVSFNYLSLDVLAFFEKLLIRYKKEKKENALFNTSIRFLNYLLYVRKQLDYPYLEIYDKKEQRKTMDLKFNSIYKFLLTKFPDKEDLYAQINQDYREEVKLINYREAHPELRATFTTKSNLFSE